MRFEEIIEKLKYHSGAWVITPEMVPEDVNGSIMFETWSGTRLILNARNKKLYIRQENGSNSIINIHLLFESIFGISSDGHNIVLSPSDNPHDAILIWTGYPVLNTTYSEETGFEQEKIEDKQEMYAKWIREHERMY